MDINQIINRHATVEKALHGILPIFLSMLTDTGAVVGHLVHHLPAGVGEVGIVLEEVAVAIDVSHHELLIDRVIAPHQVGVAGVVVDHHLVDLRQAILVALLELFVLHAKRPVGVASGEATVGGHFVQVVSVKHFENGLVEVETVVTGIAFDLDLQIPQFGSQASIISGAEKTHSRILGLVSALYAESIAVIPT